jgi:hypothetical protein
MTVLLVDIRSWLQTGTQIVAGKLESLRREARKGMNENLKNSAPLRLCGLGDVNSYDILFLAKAQRIDRGKEMIFEYTLFSCCFLSRNLFHHCFVNTWLFQKRSMQL